MLFRGRAATHDAMGCRTDPFWWTHRAISHSSVTKVVVCTILSV